MLTANRRKYEFGHHGVIQTRQTDFDSSSEFNLYCVRLAVDEMTFYEHMSDGFDDNYYHECSVPVNVYMSAISRLESEGLCEIIFPNTLNMQKGKFDSTCGIRLRKDGDHIKYAFFGKDPKDHFEREFEKGMPISALKVRYVYDPVPVLDALDVMLKDLELNDLEKPALKQKLLEEFSVKKLEDITLNKRGFTGKGVIKAGRYAIKVDNAKRLEHELGLYQAVSGTSFDQFCPSLADKSQFLVLDSIGFLTLSNLDSGFVPGFMKANKLYGHLLLASKRPLFNCHDITYNLFLIGLFHASASGFNPAYCESLPLALYTDLQGVPHHLTADAPMKNASGEAYRRYKETMIRDKSYISIINNYNQMLGQWQKDRSLPIIDGDWKPDNVYRGHKVDFSCVGHGLEIDDLAYYLSDSSLGVDFEGFRHHIKEYAILRSLHDDNFVKRGNLFEEAAASAWLRQLVLRHSVMKKRDMMDDSKYAQRRYFVYRIGQVLKGGRFV